MEVLDKIKDELKKSIHSCWDKGVHEYEVELLERVEHDIKDGSFSINGLSSSKILERELLNGAPNWHEYSWGGCSLIYDREIAERLCTPTELKRTKHGKRKPNSSEEWLDVQYRALTQAATRIIFAAKRVIAQNALDNI